MKNKILKMAVPFSIFLSGCGSMEPLPFDSLTDIQPRVLSVSPADGDNFEGNQIEVTFSQPIDETTVSAKSFLVTAVEEGEVDLSLLLEKAEDRELLSHPGMYELSEDGKTVRFHAEEPFPPDIRCGILITPEILSADHLPLNQTPGEGPAPFFSSFYAVRSGSEGESNLVQTNEQPSTLSPPSFLFLNEVFYDAVGLDTNGDLFIELKGEPERSLANYRVYFVSGEDGRIVDSLTLPRGMKTNAEGFFVIADAVTGQSGVTHVANADWVQNFDPPNGPDCIQLVNPAGNLVDALGYGSPLILRAQNNLFCYEGEPVPDAPSGSSLTRPAETLDTDNNVDDWVVNSTPSPGEIFQGEIEPP